MYFEIQSGLHIKQRAQTPDQLPYSHPFIV